MLAHVSWEVILVFVAQRTWLLSYDTCDGYRSFIAMLGRCLMSLLIKFETEICCLTSTPVALGNCLVIECHRLDVGSVGSAQYTWICVSSCPWNEKGHARPDISVGLTFRASCSVEDWLCYTYLCLWVCHSSRASYCFRVHQWWRKPTC